MTTQQGNPVFSPNGNLFIITGRILGGSGVATVKGVARGWSLTYVSTGLYRVTSDINYAYWLGGSSPGIMSSGTALNARVKAYVGGDNAAATAMSWDLLVVTTSSGSATDLGAADQLFFGFNCARTVRP
jgi:hypothetical protein